jgi:hypothetical protein
MRPIERRTPGRRTSLRFLISLLAIACSGSDVTTPVPPPPVLRPTLDMTVTLTSIEVVQDCDDRILDGIFDNLTEGEFQYRFWISWPDGSNPAIATTDGYPDNVRRGGAGTKWNDGRRERRVLAGPGPHTIRVSFNATEWDSFLGTWNREEWLDNQTKTAQFTIRTGDVRGGNTSASFSLGNDRGNYANCHLRANFSVSTVEGTAP